MITGVSKAVVLVGDQDEARAVWSDQALERLAEYVAKEAAP